MSVGTVVALLLSTQPAVANVASSAPCCRVVPPLGCGLCGEWTVGAHALYFVPIACPYTYAETSVQVFPPSFDTLRGRAQIVRCRADWGFRIFGNYLNDCLFAGVSYQWYEASASSSITADTLFIRGGATIAGLSRARARVGIDYQNVDIRVGTYVLQRCISALYLYGNARWVDLSHRRAVRQDSLTTGATQRITEKSQLQGGAIGIGFGGDVDVWCGIGAFIEGNLLGVIGSRSVKNVEFRQITPGQAPVVQREFYPSDTCVIPEFDFRIGVNYTYGCGCWELAGEVGYELDYFWHGSVFPRFAGSTVAQGFSDFRPTCEDLGFSGLYFGVRVGF